jgi:hypothetical protein
MNSPMRDVRQAMQEFYRSVEFDGVRALRVLPELYTQDICSYTPTDDRFGLEAFTQSWVKMLQQFPGVAFSDIWALGTERRFAFCQTMTVKMAVGDPSRIPIVTVFCTNDSGKVYWQRDYWDTAGALAGISPIFEKAYRSVVGKLLGGGEFSAGNAGLPSSGKDDGCYHPRTETELVQLIQQTISDAAQLRVVGSGHSVWSSIVPEGFTRHADPRWRVVMLDEYERTLRFFPNPDRPGETLVEVGAGVNLGYAPRLARAFPISPSHFGDDATPNVTRERSWEESLCYALQQRGYALPDLGGISHQTVGGFLSTGSAGGSCKWSFSDAVHAIRIVDGTGEVRTLQANGPEREAFAAAGVGLGLCGVVSTVTFRCEPTYNIVGKQTTSKTREAPDLDFYGPGDHRPNLARFLQDTDYARLMWWPQRGFDRLVVWKAERRAPEPGFQPKPYQELGRLPVAKQLGASVLYTILGNLETPDRIGDHLRTIQSYETGGEWKAALKDLVAAMGKAPPPDPTYSLRLQEKLPWLADLVETVLGSRHPAITLGDAWGKVAEVAANLLDKLLAGTLSSKLIHPLAKVLATAVPYVIGDILDPFVGLGPRGEPVVQTFQDSWYLGLPMDDAVDDLLLPTFFTELWIPFTPEGGEVERVIGALRKLFDADGTAEGCYKATGPFTIEIYATKADQRFWLSPATGEKNVLRVDVFWFGYNSGSPVDVFYPQFWKALEGFEYRLHWGKFLPKRDQLSPAELLGRYPGWPNFKQVRKQLDPHGIFETWYWREHLGLSST